LEAFSAAIDFDPLPLLNEKRKEDLPVDYFDFYNSVSSVYSAKIEGEEIDYDSFYKYKFLKVEYEPEYTKRSDDLYHAYQFVRKNELSKENILKAHGILAAHLLPAAQLGKIRTNPMYVVGGDDRIEYVACDQYKLESEFELFFLEVEAALKQEMSTQEVFYFASMMHLVLVKIHPFQDGNGRVGRLLEKWFLLHKLGEIAHAVNLEKSYFENRHNYYSSIRTLGLEYDHLDYSQALDFLLMTLSSMKP